MLIFNKEINPFLAQQIYNFYVTDEDGNPITIEKNDGKFIFYDRSMYYLSI